MPEPHTFVSEYAELLVATPRAHVPLDLRQDDRGFALLHEERELVRCALTRQGMAAAGYLAAALGAGIPAMGGAAHVRVSTGVLFRAVAIASLDLAVPESATVLERLLEEAASQRGGGGEEV